MGGYGTHRVSIVAVIIVVAGLLAGCMVVPNRGPGIGVPTAALLDSTDQMDFNRRFGNSASVAVTDMAAAPIVRAGDVRSPYAWSTSKLLLAATLIRQVGGADKLSAQEKAWIASALSASDNSAAAWLFFVLAMRTGGLVPASAAMTQTLRAAGDSQTVVSTTTRSSYSTHGQTLWSVENQAQFLASLARTCLLDSTSTAYLIDASSRVVPEQRFGLATVGVTTFKGGWGRDPDGKYLVRQMGLLSTPGGGWAVVAITARPADGSYASGQVLLTDVARWVAANVGPASPARTCSSASPSATPLPGTTG